MVVEDRGDLARLHVGEHDRVGVLEAVQVLRQRQRGLELGGEADDLGRENFSGVGAVMSFRTMSLRWMPKVRPSGIVMTCAGRLPSASLASSAMVAASVG
jgi:hypothetical protein